MTLEYYYTMHGDTPRYEWSLEVSTGLAVFEIFSLGWQQKREGWAPNVDAEGAEDHRRHFIVLTSNAPTQDG